MNTHTLTRRSFLVGAACACTAVLTGCAANQQFVRASIQDQHAHVPIDQLSREHSTLVYIDELAASLAIDHIEKTDTWRALLLVCTHRGCNVAPDRQGYECPCHGSRFDAEGHVTNGPANEPLAILPCHPTTTHLLVTLPI